MPFDGTNFFYGREGELNPYLKCTVYNGMHSNEYFVAFTTVESTHLENPMLVNRNGEVAINAHGFENHIFVNKKDVIGLTGERLELKEKRQEKGLVKIEEILLGDKNQSLIGINDLGDNRISRKYVPNSEIVWR